jgi:hypothetical protein
MRSETGALLTKISAVISMIVAILVFLAAIGVAIGITVIDWIGGFAIITLIAAVIVFIFALLLWRAAEMMKNPRTVRSGAIWAIVLGILTLGNLAGILALIGGIIALIESGR